MSPTALTEMEKLGATVVVSNPTPAERDALLLHYTALRGAKHAVIADEIQHADGSVELRFTHYLTCQCGMARRK